MFRIKDHVDETPSVRTIRFEESLDAEPGQFVMVWVPGVDEFPMSASFTGSRFGITYKIVGEGTKALASMTPGKLVGIRGPYGRGFTPQGKKHVVVAGGTGMAALAPFIDLDVGRGAQVDVVIGARTSDELLFETRSRGSGANVHISTDDGTKGLKGLATDLASEIVRTRRPDRIFACGPEKMIVTMLGLASASATPMQASLERMMKCGIGVCDSCAIDGKHVCRDGPVFSDAELRAFVDLGVAKLDSTGRKVPV